MKRRAFFGILAGAAAACAAAGSTAEGQTFTPLGINNVFGTVPAHMPPYDSGAVFSRVPTDPGVAYHPQNVIATAEESSAVNSFLWGITSEVTTTDNPAASADTSQNAGFYSVMHDLGSVFGAGYHTDVWAEGTGTSVGFNDETYRTNPGGTVIGANMQQSGQYPGDVAYQVSGPWKKGLMRNTPGPLVSVGATDEMSVDTAGVLHEGPADNVRYDAQGNTYIGPVIRPGVTPLMVVGNPVYINGVPQ